MASCLRLCKSAGKWLPRKDSNLDKEIQNLSCYRYTTRQEQCSGRGNAGRTLPQVNRAGQRLKQAA